MPETTLRVTWKLSRPPLRPVAYQRWDAVSPGAPGDAELESRLAWPMGTLAVLRQAFAARLSRSAGWVDACQAPAAPSAIQVAAAVYKRGVAFRYAKEEGFSQTTHQGVYAITVDTQSEAPSVLPGEDGMTIVDHKVAKLWPELSFGPEAVVLGLDEQSKSLESVALILEVARRREARGTWTVVGGGLLTDVAVFAASLVKAPVRLVPTTLLAMADACVGGKAGVNFPPYGKNQIGSFHFPVAVAVWSGWLKTLSSRELRAGGAECLKHAFLKGDMGLARRLAQALNARDLVALGALLATVIQVKAEVVAEDPGEAGRRATLNFGHTLAHALEAMSQQRVTGEAVLLHGEAVALGMVFAIALSRRVCDLRPDAGDSMISALRDAGCLISKQDLARCLGGADLTEKAVFQELRTYMGHDKKNTGTMATSQWVLLSAPGQVARSSQREWTTSVFESELSPAWKDFLKALD